MMGAPFDELFAAGAGARGDATTGASSGGAA